MERNERKGRKEHWKDSDGRFKPGKVLVSLRVKVFVSTDYVTCFNAFNREHPCTEESFRLSPVSYGVQKACVELLLSAVFGISMLVVSPDFGRKFLAVMPTPATQHKRARLKAGGKAGRFYYSNCN